MRRCPGLEEGRTVALPLEKLGTTYPPTVEGASVSVFEATSQGAVVVKNGLAEVV